jgi:hypothetical protein
MPLFGHRENLRRLQESGVPGLSDIAVRQGWEPAPGAPFAGLLEAGIREISRAVHEAPPGLAAPGGPADAGPVASSDAYRGALDGRMVLVANAWTSIAGALRGMAVCAAELPAALTLLSVQPRRFPAALALPGIATGDPAFDGRFLVQATADLGGPVQDVLTRDARQRMLARDDWFFRAGRGLLGCVTPEPFRAVDEVSTRIGEVLAIVAAIPAGAGGGGGGGGGAGHCGRRPGRGRGRRRGGVPDHGGPGHARPRPARPGHLRPGCPLPWRSLPR